ncbi:MAG: hypothetical protein M0005_16690 [Actinomycetota bacterium]|nr:hypothetical protein [Actinomycetota bacterium]
MADKLEVLAGQGMVVRFGEIAVWAGPQCSPALLSHLVAEAQRAAEAPAGGEQMANSLIAVLQRGDPEPQAPFAVVGPGPGGLSLLLHGPVQAWDSGRWLAPQPVPGWMTASIARPWPLIVLPYGASPPPQSQQGNPFDLLSGVVPGSGFVMLRPPSAPAPAVAAGGPVAVPAGAGGGPGPQPLGQGFAGPAAGGQGFPGPAAGGQGFPGSPAGGPASGGAAAAPAAMPVEVGAPGAAPPSAGPQYAGQVLGGAPGATAAPGGTVQPAPAESFGGTGLGGATSRSTFDLRNVLVPASPPLPLASSLGSALDRPEAPGVYCERGHFNHPGSSRCPRCGRPVPAGGPAVNGPRPPVGILLADDGSIWTLDKSYLIGADPTSAGEVRVGTARAISMRAGANHTMAPVQAEVRVSGWNVFLVDRGADGGTYWQGRSGSGWVQLGRNEQRELTDGCHLSCGGRVLTYLSAWSPGGPGAPGSS